MGLHLMKIIMVILSNLLILLMLVLICLIIGEKFFSYVYDGEKIIFDYREFIFPLLIFLVAFFSQIKVAYWKNKITSIILFLISSISLSYNIYKINLGGFSWWFNIAYTLGIEDRYILISGILLFLVLFFLVIGSFILMIQNKS